ncbi:MAG: LysE family transporter [Rhodobacteraceae bacterium]|nr:LysE family transporter [Paracoccaceae bacterium]
MLQAFQSGFGLGIGLIAAIGAQNAFVLRQGLARGHVLAVVLFCAVSDALLIAAGVSGMAAAGRAVPALAGIMLWGGIAFLLWYGARSFLSALRGGGALSAAAGPGRTTLGATLVTIAVLTWANPHVYLDTLVFLGSVSAQYPGREAAFGAGAATASLVFFSTLGFGARLAAPVFARPRAWQVLDVAIGLTMWAIAARLVLSGAA